MKGENYFAAEIATGRVGADQAAPRKPFDYQSKEPARSIAFEAALVISQALSSTLRASLP